MYAETDVVWTCMLRHATEQEVIGYRKEDYVKISNVKADTGWKQISVQILDF